MPANDALDDFEAIKNRLEEILDLVGNDDLPLDDALDLYEEAIALGMRVSDAIEEGIVIDEQMLEDPAAQDRSSEEANEADDAASNDMASDKQDFAQPDGLDVAMQAEFE